MNNGTLQNLAALSEDLNDASDNLSQQITDFETALNKLRLGVRAWVVLRSWPSPSYGYGIDEGVSIGYGKHNGKWALLYSEWNDIFPEESRVQRQLRSCRSSSRSWKRSRASSQKTLASRLPR